MVHPPQILLIDNYDSFTYNLYDYFCQLNTICTVLRNDAAELSSLDMNQYQGIVLSPGPGRPEDAGILMQLIDQYCHKKAILGICLGMQAIGLHFGAKLVHANIPIHGKTSALFHRQEGVFNNIDSPTDVMRYHSLILEQLPSCLSCTAWTDSNEIMAIQHQSLALTGLQFHPESILTKQGMQLLNNWLKTCL